MFTRAVDPVIPHDRRRPRHRREDRGAAVDRVRVSLCADPAGAGRHRRFLRQDPADERLRAGDGARGAGLRGCDRLLRCWSPCGSWPGSWPAACFRWRWRCWAISCRCNQRQVAIARLLGIALTANVLGASIAGVIGDLFGWRGVFAILGTFSLAGLASWRSGRSATRHCRRRRRSTAPRSSPTSAACSPTRAPRSASAPCSSKRSSSTDCFRTSAILLHEHRRDPRLDRRPSDRLLRGRRHPLFAGGAVSGRARCRSAT